LIFQFNQVTIDTALYRLCLSGKPVSVEPQVFDLLVYLIENRGRVVTRGELLDRLWEGKIVTDAALGASLKEVRKAVQDSGTKQEVIKTVHGRGYQFIAKVTESTIDKSSVLTNELASRRPLLHSIIAFASITVIILGVILMWVQPWEVRSEPASLERMAFPLPDKPSIAVLAFDNLSGDRDQEFISDGISEGIIRELSRFPQLFVIARNSSFTYKGHPVKIQKVSEELGVRYVVEGSLQSTDDQIRVTAQLIDATTGNHLWSNRYDGKRQDFFVVQDEITQKIVSTLAGRVELAERGRVLDNPAERLKAYEYVQQGWAQWYKWTKEANDQARELHEKALQLDPDYAEAYVGLTFVNFNDIGFSNTGLTREESLELASKAAQKAVQINPFYYRSHLALANVYMQRGNLTQAMAEYEKALELNPNATKVLASVSEVLVKLGRAEEAVVQSKLAIRLNPYHPDWYLWNLGWAQYFSGDYEDALTSIRRMRNPPNAAKRTQAFILARLGRLEESRMLASEFLQGKPDFIFEEYMKSFHFKDDAYRKKLAEDFHKAGLSN
jgi:TolB-like protein/DNA-binding winged helix-turn-helix (wHTH) protein/tetratricopeptide (TPR) repeat protein